MLKRPRHSSKVIEVAIQYAEHMVGIISPRVDRHMLGGDCIAISQQETDV